MKYWSIKTSALGNDVEKLPTEYPDISKISPKDIPANNPLQKAQPPQPQPEQNTQTQPVQQKQPVVPNETVYKEVEPQEDSSWLNGVKDYIQKSLFSLPQITEAVLNSSNKSKNNNSKNYQEVDIMNGIDRFLNTNVQAPRGCPKWVKFLSDNTDTDAIIYLNQLKQEEKGQLPSNQSTVAQQFLEVAKNNTDVLINAFQKAGYSHDDQGFYGANLDAPTGGSSKGDAAAALGDMIGDDSAIDPSELLPDDIKQETTSLLDQLKNLDEMPYSLDQLKGMVDKNNYSSLPENMRWEMMRTTAGAMPGDTELAYINSTNPNDDIALNFIHKNPKVYAEILSMKNKDGKPFSEILDPRSLNNIVYQAVKNAIFGVDMSQDKVVPNWHGIAGNGEYDPQNEQSVEDSMFQLFDLIESKDKGAFGKITNNVEKFLNAVDDYQNSSKSLMNDVFSPTQAGIRGLHRVHDEIAKYYQKEAELSMWLARSKRQKMENGQLADVGIGNTEHEGEDKSHDFRAATAARRWATVNQRGKFILNTLSKMVNEDDPTPIVIKTGEPLSEEDAQGKVEVLVQEDGQFKIKTINAIVAKQNGKNIIHTTDVDTRPVGRFDLLKIANIVKPKVWGQKVFDDLTKNYPEALVKPKIEDAKRADDKKRFETRNPHINQMEKENPIDIKNVKDPLESWRKARGKYIAQMIASCNTTPDRLQAAINQEATGKGKRKISKTDGNYINKLISGEPVEYRQDVFDEIYELLSKTSGQDAETLAKHWNFSHSKYYDKYSADDTDVLNENTATIYTSATPYLYYRKMNAKARQGQNVTSKTSDVFDPESAMIYLLLNSRHAHAVNPQNWQSNFRGKGDSSGPELYSIVPSNEEGIPENMYDPNNISDENERADFWKNQGPKARDAVKMVNETPLNKIYDPKNERSDVLQKSLLNLYRTQNPDFNAENQPTAKLESQLNQMFNFEAGKLTKQLPTNMQSLPDALFQLYKDRDDLIKKQEKYKSPGKQQQIQDERNALVQRQNEINKIRKAPENAQYTPLLDQIIQLRNPKVDTKSKIRLLPRDLRKRLHHLRRQVDANADILIYKQAMAIYKALSGIDKFPHLIAYMLKSA